MNFFGFQFIIGNSSVTATKKFQNILSSSVIAGGIYGEHLSQNRRIDRNITGGQKNEYGNNPTRVTTLHPEWR